MSTTKKGQSGLMLVLTEVREYACEALRGLLASRISSMSSVEIFTVSEKVKESWPESMSKSKLSREGLVTSKVYSLTGKASESDTTSTRFPFMSRMATEVRERKVSSGEVASPGMLFKVLRSKYNSS